MTFQRKIRVDKLQRRWEGVLRPLHALHFTTVRHSPVPTCPCLLDMRRRIGTFYLLAQKLVFCNSDLDKSTTHMRTLMIYLFLTGVHPTSVHLIGGCLMGVYLTCVYLLGVYLTDVRLTYVHLMA
jgi:hypothetical protein